MTDLDTNEHDLKEKLDILLKKSFGFPSTSEKKLWYQEVNVNYNNYIIVIIILIKFTNIKVSYTSLEINLIE